MRNIIPYWKTILGDLVPLPKGGKLVRCKWVYRKKFGPDGKMDKHKARLVAKGFSQAEGI